METETKENNSVAEAQKVLNEQQIKEHDACWTELIDVLKKHGFKFLPSVILHPQMGMRFVVDIVKEETHAGK
jgi:hypothetical protein